jgi:hypothetical protein
VNHRLANNNAETFLDVLANQNGWCISIDISNSIKNNLLELTERGAGGVL